MGMYNSLYYRELCPICKKHHETEIQFYCGWLNCIDYKVGDRIDWGQDKMAWGNTLGCGIRPEGGNFIGEGYAECEKHHKDYWVDVIIEKDIIIAVKYRPDKKGYITR